MDNRQAFQFGFLLRCAEAGLDAGQSAKLAQSADQLCKNAGWADVLQSLLGSAKWLSLAAPPLAGAGVGWLAAKGTTPIEDKDDLYDREMTAEMRLQAKKLRERKKMLQNAGVV